MSVDPSSQTIQLSQIWTWPNLFTFLRLLAIPVFLWLLFGPEDLAGAGWLLAGLGATDWVDGWLARRFGQMTAFGAVFDPAVDRLLFLFAVPATLVVGATPLIVGLLSLLREFLVAVASLVMALLGVERGPVTWEGKTGTFLLMFAFPMFLGSVSDLSFAQPLRWLAWTFAVPGLAYSWYSALFQYLPALKRQGQGPAEGANVD